MTDGKIVIIAPRELYDAWIKKSSIIEKSDGVAYSPNGVTEIRRGSDEG